MDRLTEAQGYIVKMQATNPLHYGEPMMKERVNKGDVVSDFGALLKGALTTVNDRQVQADSLVVQAGTSPDTVDVHDVMNALAEADLSISLTKAVIDRAVRAYQELTTAR